MSTFKWTIVFWVYVLVVVPAIIAGCIALPFIIDEWRQTW